MKRFIEGEDRSQSTLFPEHLDDYIAGFSVMMQRILLTLQTLCGAAIAW